MDLGTSWGSAFGRSKKGIHTEIEQWEEEGLGYSVRKKFHVHHLCGCSGLLVSLLSTGELLFSEEESAGFCIGMVDRRATPGEMEV